MGKHKIIVVGGGAAGMTSAIAAAEEGCPVTMIERNTRLGCKILMTGNGKCNLGNINLSEADYYSGSGKNIKEYLSRFGLQETLAFFRKLGLIVKEKNGYLYPLCEQASAVLDVLRLEVNGLGIEVVTDTKISHIRRKDEGIILEGNGRSFRCDRAVIACGGKAAPKTGSDGSGFKLARQLGMEITPTVPALVQLTCREDYMKAVAGVRCDAQIHILEDDREIACERGELQLTDYGISGIPVFQLSRIVNYRLREIEELTAVIDFMPGMTKEDFEAICHGRRLLLANRSAEEFFTGMVNKKLMLLILRLSGIRPGMPAVEMEPEKIRCFYELCRHFKLHIIGSKAYDSAQVCAGGVKLDEVTQNLEAICAPGIFLAGEVLDVDGRCGGYNLQWAWTSGYLAGKAAAGAPVKADGAMQSHTL